MTNFGRMSLEMRRRTHLLRKTRNKFFEISDFRKNIVYSVNISAQTNDKILISFQKIRREHLYKNCMNQMPTDLFCWFLRSLTGPPFPEPKNFFRFLFFHSCKGLSRFPLDEGEGEG